MYIQIVNFQLKDMNEADYRVLCDQLAPTFADLPGLVSKVWLADAETNTYGGVYTWESQGALENYKQSELFHNVANHPNFANITSREFGVLGEPTQITRGAAEAIA